MSWDNRAMKLEEVRGKYDHLVRPDGLVHRTLFTDPAIFEEEMTKIFGGTWVFLLHEAEIPNPHDFSTITVGRRPTIVTRTADGKIVALLNRCPHRGSMVCIEQRGSAKRFECPYHGWTFDSAGELVSVPYPEGYGPSFDRKENHLGRFPRIESYRGYVFGSLNKDVEPLAEWLGAAREVIDWSVDNENAGPNGFRIAKGTQMVYRGNWKHQNDNNCDAYHAPFLHASTAKMNRQRYGTGKLLDHIKNDESPMCIKYLGNGHKLMDQRPAIGSPWLRARPVPGREVGEAAIRAGRDEDDASKLLDLTGRAGINLIIYPNLLIFGNGAFCVYEPIAVDRTNVRWYTALINDAPEDVNLLRLRFSEDFNNVAARDDNEGFERMQYALETIPEMEWISVSRGLGTDREADEGNGVVRGNIMDETGIRGSYHHWVTLMNADTKLSAV